MKRYLLDTHYIIWLLLDTSKINANIKSIFKNSENQIYYSDISLWEIAIKTKIEKLDIKREIKEIPPALHILNIENLQLKQSHIFETLEIPLMPEHRDPFDRMLLAQAKTENLIFITNDSKFKLYSGVEVII